MWMVIGVGRTPSIICIRANFMKGTHQHALNPHKYTPLLTVRCLPTLVCFSLSVDYFFEMGTKLVCFLFVEHLKYLKRLSVCASARTPPRPFLLADILQRRLAVPYPCSLGAILTILTCLLVQEWRSTTIMSIPNERSCCWAPQGQPPPDLRRPVLRGAASVAGARALAGRARRVLRLSR